MTAGEGTLKRMTIHGSLAWINFFIMAPRYGIPKSDLHSHAWITAEFISRVHLRVTFIKGKNFFRCWRNISNKSSHDDFCSACCRNLSICSWLWYPSITWQSQSILVRRNTDWCRCVSEGKGVGVNISNITGGKGYILSQIDFYNCFK